MNNTTIYIVRHGQSIGNEKRLYLGHTDLDLSALGYKQAEETAKHLSYVNFSAVYSSDLIRAYNTAAPNAKMRGLEVIPSKELRELYIGKWEGRPVEELLRDEKELFTEGWHKNFGTFTLPGGESVWGGAERFTRETERIASLHRGEVILIAAHAAVIRAFWGKISGVAPAELAEAVPFPTNASYSIVEYDGARLVPIKYSCDGHLSEVTGLTGDKKKND